MGGKTRAPGRRFRTPSHPTPWHTSRRLNPPNLRPSGLHPHKTPPFSPPPRIDQEIARDLVASLQTHHRLICSLVADSRTHPLRSVLHRISLWNRSSSNTNRTTNEQHKMRALNNVKNCHWSLFSFLLSATVFSIPRDNELKDEPPPPFFFSSRTHPNAGRNRAQLNIALVRLRHVSAWSWL